MKSSYRHFKYFAWRGWSEINLENMFFQVVSRNTIRNCPKMTNTVVSRSLTHVWRIMFRPFHNLVLLISICFWRVGIQIRKPIKVRPLGSYLGVLQSRLVLHAHCKAERRRNPLGGTWAPPMPVPIASFCLSSRRFPHVTAYVYGSLFFASARLLDLHPITRLPFRIQEFYSYH